MKTKLLFLVFLFAILPLSAQKISKQERKAKALAEVEAIIDSSQFVFTAESAVPQNGKTVFLTSLSYTLEIKKDSAISDLPFYGTAYSIPYGGSGGIKFKGAVENFKVSSNKKNTAWQIEFTVKENNETYTCFFTIFSKESASLSVNSIQRSNISYNGTIGPILKKEN